MGTSQLGRGLKDAYQRLDCLSERGRRESSLKHEVGQANLLCQRNLAADTTDRFCAGEAVAFLQAGDLGLAVGGYNDDLVDALVDSGFEEEGDLINDDRLGMFSSDGFGQPGLLASDSGMNDSFELPQLRSVVEDDMAESMAIDGAFRI